MSDRRPSYDGVTPIQLRHALTPTPEKKKVSSATKAILAAVGTLAGGGGSHYAMERDTRDKSVATQVQLSEHIKLEDERHAQTQLTLKELKDAQSKAATKDDTHAILEAIRLKK